MTVTVRVAIRIALIALVVKLAVIVALPLPEEFTVHHAGLLDTVQLVFVVTLNDVVHARAATFWFEGPTVSKGAAASCVTVTVCAGSPATVTVIVATREENEVFSE